MSDAHANPPHHTEEVPLQATIGKTDEVLIPINSSEVQVVVYQVPGDKRLIIDYAGEDLRGRSNTGFTYPDGEHLKSISKLR